MKENFFFLISNARNFQRESVKGEQGTKGQMQTQRYKETSYVFQGIEVQKKGSKEHASRK